MPKRQKEKQYQSAREHRANQSDPIQGKRTANKWTRKGDGGS